MHIFAALVRPHPNSTAFVQRISCATQLLAFCGMRAASDQLITCLYYQTTTKDECQCGLFARRLNNNMAAHQNTAFFELSSSSSVSSDGELEAAVEKVSSKVSAAQPAAIARERSLLLNPSGESKRRRCGPSTKMHKRSLHECVAEYPNEKLTVESSVSRTYTVRRRARRQVPSSVMLVLPGTRYWKPKNRSSNQLLRL